MSAVSRRGLFGLFAGASALALAPSVFAHAPADVIDAAPFAGEYVPLVTTHTAYGLGYIATREDLMDNLYETVASKRLGDLRRTIADDIFENGIHADV